MFVPGRRSADSRPYAVPQSGRRTFGSVVEGGPRHPATKDKRNLSWDA